MKAQKAKMKGNEAPQTKNEENQRPQGQKSENRLGYGADKFFVWDLGKTDRFWQLVGGGPRGRPPQEEMLLNMDHAHGGSPCKEQISMRQKDAPPEGPKGHKEPKETPPQGPTWQNGRPKGQNGGREAKMKAQKAKMKGNEAPQTKNEENQRPQAQKLEN